ncbi:MAG: phenylalanine--tRNA ligase subunit beta [Woeseiaceae bacterium]
MKIPESWLREWADPALDTGALVQRLTMAGHEVEGVEREGEGLDGIVVAEVLEVGKHPAADKLSLCKVSDGSGKVSDVVCGAPNVVAGMKSAFATPGVTLPDGSRLKKAKIRGVASEGMLCSAAELGLGEDADGILALPGDAPVGAKLADYLRLPDTVIDVNLTPNRGDCFSIAGLGRDVAALTATRFTPLDIGAVPAAIDDTHPAEVQEPAGCPAFAGRVIRGIDPAARSPLWMVERLRRCGLRPIHPVVDVTNYVMLELGQPMHAYDLGRLRGPIRPRLARPGETVTLLDEREVEVNPDTLVISDDSGVIGLAGIMGGLHTAVSDATVDVFFEAAFWPPPFVAGRARAYGLHTDASLRFERGVDPEGQGRAVERETALLLEIAGGAAGPLVVTTAAAHLPKPKTIRLRRDRISRLLGVEIDDATVTDILQRLGMAVVASADGWDVVAPSHRFDVEVEVDLIEEVARVFGYDAIPETTAVEQTPLPPVTESEVDPERVAATLVARDYREVVTYSFIDADSDAAICGRESAIVLSNPISSDMSVMRSSLWPGMLMAVASNAARQQTRIRLFEIGTTFTGSLEQPEEHLCIAAVATGSRLPEQWGAQAQSVDFFDLKADVLAVLDLAGDSAGIEFEAVEHAALQPGQAARITRADNVVGTIGKLHPRHARRFDLKGDVFLFEIDAKFALESAPPKVHPVSKFPSIRRDIAVVVDERISASDLVRTVAATAPALISEVRVFDVFKGSGIEAGLKSVALGLILQETSRTLTDVDADAVLTAAVRKLQDKFGAELRD